MNRSISQKIMLPMIGLFVVASVVMTACGGDGTGSGSSAVDPADLVGTRQVDPERILSFEDFKTAGFKKSSTYDVAELPGAEEAYFGFWGLDPYDRKDFELRIFASQLDAIELGTELAAERTWPDAKLTKATSSWPVGLNDARKCEGVQGMGFGTCDVPKFYDYIFVGNVILFCPGASVDVARQNCDELIENLQ